MQAQAPSTSTTHRFTRGMGGMGAIRATTPRSGRAAALVATAGLAAMLLATLTGATAVRADAVDLWVTAVEYEPQVPGFEGYDPVIPTPVLVTVTVRKQGPAPVSGAMLAIRLNGSTVQVAPILDLPLQDFQATLDARAGDQFEATVDFTSIIPEWDELNNRLGWEFGFGHGSQNPCAPYPKTLTVSDPDGSGDLTLSCRSMLRNQRSGKFPYALLVLPPYEVLEAEAGGTMQTELEISSFSGEENSTSAGISAAIAVEAEFGLGDAAKVTMGTEVETGVEQTLGRETEVTQAETFDAQTPAAQGPLTGDHTVVMTQTRYDVCKYEVTAGSQDGDFVWIAIPDDDPTDPNPELTAYDLDDYDAVKDDDAVGLKAAHTIGDSDSYPGSKHGGSHIDEPNWNGTPTDVAEMEQTVATGGADWETSISESSSSSSTLYVKFNMYAKGKLGGISVQASFGSMAGWSHRIYEGTEATYHWKIGPVIDVDDEYKVGGFARNQVVNHDGRKDGVLIMCYYVDEPSGGGGWDDWDRFHHWLGNWSASTTYNPGHSAGGLIADYEALLNDPLLHDPASFYAQLDLAAADNIAWGLQFDPSQTPGLQPFLDKSMAARDEFEWILANDPQNPAYEPHAIALLDNANIEGHRAFDPRPSAITPEPPREGGAVRIVYNPARGALPPGPPVYLRVGYDGWQGMHDEPMALDGETGCWEAVTPAPPGVETLDYVFTNGSDVDDRAGLGWHAPAAGAVRTHHGNGGGGGGGTGNLTLSCTAQGILGYTDSAHSAGDGLRYPAGGPNYLYTGGLWVGTADFVANRDYDADPAPEWVAAARAPGGIHRWSAASAELSQAAYTDSGAAAPRGLVVYQGAATRANAPDDDFAVISYLVRNEGATPLAGVYVGQFADLDIDEATFQENQGSTDAARQLVYMYRDAQAPYAGVALLDEGMAANLTLIHNPTYVWPAQTLSDADRWSFLDGDLSAGTSTEASDWSVLASAGPYALAPGEAVVVTFAVVAGDDLDDLLANVDRAWQWTLPAGGTTGVAEPAGPGEVPAFRGPALFQNAPNPFNPSTRIVFELAEGGAVTLRVYDPAGRAVRTLLRGQREAGRTAVVWDGRNDAGRAVGSGVYFCRLESAGRVLTRKMVLMK